MLDQITTCRDLYVHNRTQEQLQVAYHQFHKLTRQLSAVSENLTHNREFREFLLNRFPTVSQRLQQNLASCQADQHTLQARFTAGTLTRQDPALREFLHLAGRTVRTFDCVASVYLQA